MIDETPEMVLHPADLHENLNEVPAAMPQFPHRLDPAAKIVPNRFHQNRTVSWVMSTLRLRVSPRRFAMTAGSGHT